MALKILMLKRSIDKKKADLELLRAKDNEFQIREADLEKAINEAETAEQEQAVTEEIEKFESEKQAHEEEKNKLSQEIEGLEADLAEAEAFTLKRLRQIQMRRIPLTVTSLLRTSFMPLRRQHSIIGLKKQ